MNERMDKNRVDYLGQPGRRVYRGGSVDGPLCRNAKGVRR